MKVIQKHPVPRQSGYTSLSLAAGAKMVGMGQSGGEVVLYVESQPWSSGYVCWEIQVVREGESYPDGMEVLGAFDEPNGPVGYSPKLFVVGRING